MGRVEDVEESVYPHLDKSRLKSRKLNVSTIISFSLIIPINASHINYKIGLFCCSDCSSKTRAEGTQNIGTAGDIVHLQSRRASII